jgi:hypothetical protein
VSGVIASGNYFQVLGVQAEAGRTRTASRVDPMVALRTQ